MRTVLFPIGFIFTMIFLSVAAVATSQTLWETEVVAAEQPSGNNVAGLEHRK